MKLEAETWGFLVKIETERGAEKYPGDGAAGIKHATLSGEVPKGLDNTQVHYAVPDMAI
jgi:hypothetical protein